MGTENTQTFGLEALWVQATLNRLSWVRMGISLLIRLFFRPLVYLKYFYKHFCKQCGWGTGRDVWNGAAWGSRGEHHRKHLGPCPNRSAQPHGFEQRGDRSRWTCCQEHSGHLVKNEVEGDTRASQETSCVRSSCGRWWDHSHFSVQHRVGGVQGSQQHELQHRNWD